MTYRVKRLPLKIQNCTTTEKVLGWVFHPASGMWSWSDEHTGLLYVDFEQGLDAYLLASFIGDGRPEE